MARQARAESPTGYYHIMMRGNNAEAIFEFDEQKKFFLSLLHQEEALIEIVAYCIMNNHVHIITKCEITDLSKAIKRLNIRYAMKYNYLNNRVAHVFQDRYKSEIITSEIYLNEVIRYVHNNPVAAQIVEKAENYPWSSYNEYLRNIKIISRKQKEFIMKLFSNNKEVFKNFHVKKDRYEYLDTKETIENIRIKNAQELITEYCEEKGITKRKQIIKNQTNLHEIVKKLLTNTKLTHRQISKLLEISSSLVHEINLQ
ncbi:MAG: transposase [Eubacteriaceae bacterium]